MLLFLKNVFGFVKKAFIIFAVFMVVINLFIYFINKDKPKVTIDFAQQNSNEIYKTINDPKLNSSKEGKVAIAVYRSIMCGLIGEACTNNPKDADKNFDKSLFGFVSNLIVLPYSNPPASFSYWAVNGLANAGLVPKSYAAEGIGFASIKPFMEIWKIFRNLAYMILVLVLIAIGFMIMFRMKISQQTVIAVENSLPKIIISLLLITFSFAIAGFLIDLMYVIVLLSISLLSSLDIGDLNQTNMRNLQNNYIGSGFGQIFPYGLNVFYVGNSITELLPQAIKWTLKGLISFIISVGLARLITAGPREMFKSFNDVGGVAGIVGNLVGFNVGKLFNAPAWIVELIFTIFLLPIASGIIIGILFSITLLFFVFRIFFMLINAYIKVLILIIFAPLILLGEAFPGKHAFGFWFKSLLVELMTFPLVVLITLIGYAIITISVTSPSAMAVFRPPFLGGIDTKAFTMMVGTGIVLLIPDLIKTARGLMGSKDLPFNIGAGTFMGGISTVTGGGMGLLGTFSSINLGIGGITGLLGGDTAKKFGATLREKKAGETATQETPS